MLEFNPDGSIKLSDAQARQNEIERQSFIIAREQISVKPAIAQVRITLPECARKIDEMISFYYKIDVSRFESVEHSAHKIDERTLLIKVDKGSMLMYGLLNFMIDCFKSKLSQEQGQRVIVRGSWDNYSNASIF
ncbi:MAG: hypothetical protein WC475_04180 [Candidatus Paceibacterota bacterium]